MPESYKVTIGIPTLNGPDRLERCLESIKKYTPLDKLNSGILVCDDGSLGYYQEGNKRVTAQYEVPMLMNGARLGVPESWNRLSRHGIVNWGSEIVVLLNDDVEVVPDWLDVLVFSVRKNPHAGMIGLNAWQGVNSLVFEPPPVPAYNEAALIHGHGMLATMGFCFAFAADKFNAVGGFDNRYFCFFEEIDFGVSLLHKGWPSYMATYPLVIHQGGATTSEEVNIKAGKVIAESRAKFKEKWVGIAHQRELFLGREWPRAIHWNTLVRNWED